MLVFVLIWGLLVGDSHKVCTLPLWWCQFPILTFVSSSDFMFPIHYGNLGVRALPLEFVFWIMSCLVICFFPFSLCITWNDFLEWARYMALYGTTPRCSPSWCYITPASHGINPRFSHHSILKSTPPQSNERAILFCKGVDFEQTPILNSVTYRS